MNGTSHIPTSMYPHSQIGIKEGGRFDGQIGQITIEGIIKILIPIELYLRVAHGVLKNNSKRGWAYIFEKNEFYFKTTWK
ncbi:hypothetical protein JOC93_000008 [Priestia taiwanensis]|nr:hypothetical protein [Priestia taiwanensis]